MFLFLNLKHQKREGQKSSNKGDLMKYQETDVLNGWKRTTLLNCIINISVWKLVLALVVPEFVLVPTYLRNTIMSKK